MSSVVEKYLGKVAPVGNSKGIRLDAAFFNAHPEFEGEVRVSVIAVGQVLLSVRSFGAKAKTGERRDPVLFGFLCFLEAKMTTHPNLITAADPVQLARISKLVK